MSVDHETPIIAFLWRPAEITSSVMEAARHTRTRAVFDLSGQDLESAGLALLRADATGDVADLKIAAGGLADSSLKDLLRETGIGRIWVELHHAVLEGDPARHLERIAELCEEFVCIPVVGDFALVTDIIEKYPQINKIALKGCEAAGFVSSETIFTLYSAARSLIAQSNAQRGLFVWGGVGTPEAAAAFLAAGAKGIVFESLHWLTDLVDIGDDLRGRIAKIRPQHTDLTGLNLGVPCRLFNKGNSRAVKELRQFAGSLCGEEVGEEQRRFFANKIAKEAVEPLASEFGREELIPIGVEAAFAQSFVTRFGSSTETAVDRFLAEVEALCAASGEKARAFVESDTARELGTRYPFVQGAMSWITDVPEFARAVADAGGLPTIALGLMTGDILTERLGRLPQVMDDRPYAVNVITLMENPNRDAQLAWIRAAKPRFAVIAAGEPSHAKELLQSGIEVIYIAPNEELLKMAFEAGVRWVICEGNEAGGHVGEHTTLTLAQIVLETRRQNPDLFAGRRVILAGGVWNRETALMAAMLGADAIQMGTSYLATREITETGAIPEMYQRMILESAPGSTVITGEGTGLRVRSLKTKKIDSVCALERDFASGSEDEASFRRKIETLTAGSLFVAARGLDRPGGRPLDPDAYINEGQFMSGACAGMLREVRSVEDFHAELAEGPFAEGLPYVGPIREAARPRVSGVDLERTEPSRLALSQPAARSRAKERIAITGMAIVNSLGNSPEEVWAASVASRTGIIEVPMSKWDHSLYFHPRPRMADKTYCSVGAFMNVDVSRKDIGMAPQDFRTMTASTKITMLLAKQALERSGILDSDVPRERIGVIISQNSGEAAATLSDVIIRGSAKDIVAAVKRVVSLTPEAEASIEEEVTAGKLHIDDTTLLGRLNCSAGGFICNKHGFMGPSFSVSAACATALVALYSAYQMIRNGIIDAAVIGGAEEYLTPIHFLEFSALGALAGLSGVERPPYARSRPFDADRDGMVLGEGGGVIVIERESIARRRGAPIHGYITAMGASNNHLGMVESSRITQELAIAAAFADAPYGPDAVDMIECHATSTMQGDVEEVHALSKFFNDSGKLTVLTSFKSQIGHTLGASGVNSLIRGIMAMKDGIFPPTLNYEKPDPDIALQDHGFHVLPAPAEWPRRNGEPRRFQVNAFGFGGSNYVLQIEEALDATDAVLVSTPEPTPEATYATEPVRVEEQTGQAEFIEGLYLMSTEIGGNRYRVGVVADSEKEATGLIAASEPLGDGQAAPKRLRALARQGIHLGKEDGKPLPLAFVFPGQGSHYAGMSHELYEKFPVIKHWMDRAAEVADFDILHLMFYDREEDLQKTRWQQPALFTMEYAMVQYLVSLGIRPTALAGHSLGELTALCLAGVYSFEDGFRIVNKRAVCMDKACTMHVDPGVMMAVDAPLEYLRELLKGRDDIHITNINSPKQVVLGGNGDIVKEFGEQLKQEGYRRTLLRVSMAFHSPIMRCIHDELEEFVSTIEFHAPRIPVISNTTTEPFPSDPVEIKKILMAHLESPVHWMHNVRTLATDFGVRLFVEVGPRDILSNMIADILDDAECIQTCLPSAESLMFRTAMAQLYAKGHLKPEFETRFVSFPQPSKTAKAVAAQPAGAPRPVPAIRPVAAHDPLQWLIQREINAFVVESFGRFLKPTLLAAIRREHDPNFSEDDLSRLLQQIAPASVPLSVQPAAAQPAAVAPAAVRPAQPGPAALEAPVQQTGDLETSDVTETVIQLIMDATGYERDEIDANMDLREDLAIRSSRLPVIMDALEGRFGIKIELEDFMDVRTIKDISEKIVEVAARMNKEIGPAAGVSSPVPTAAELAPVVKTGAEVEKKSIKRLVFTETALKSESFHPVDVDTMDTVVVLSPVAGTSLTKEIGDTFRRDYGVPPTPMIFLESAGDGEEAVCDLRTSAGAAKAAQFLREQDSLAGLVLVADQPLDDRLTDAAQISNLLQGFFDLLKVFMESPAKKFVLLLQKTGSPDARSHVLAQGLLGMFLSLTHEFSSVQFRAVRLDEKTDPRVAIRGALDRSQKVIEVDYRDGNAYGFEGRVSPSIFEDGQGLTIGPEDVVIFSGGAYGITYTLARSLIPFGCKMVFLGRTRLDPDIDFRRLIAEEIESFEALAAEVREAKPELPADRVEAEVAKVARALEIIRNVEAIRSEGIDAAYYSCDVTDPQRVAAVVKEVVKRFGKVTGIVHGAGVIKDSFFKQMELEAFSSVVDAKFLGAWNLYTAAKNAGLRFFVCLSSAAAIQGNPGQVNYSCGNRAMSALMQHLRAADPGLVSKALMLPPIEGAGMAENAEIRALMKRMNAEYVHADELAGLFVRELFIAPPDDTWVLFMRSLPDVKTVLLDQGEAEPADDGLDVATVRFSAPDFPMIDAVRYLDLAKGEMTAARVFSWEKDPWIPDHKPFEFLKNPLVSAIMALETFQEAAKILNPHLEVYGIRDAEFLDIIDCPPKMERSSVIMCTRSEARDGEILTRVSLATKEISPSGQVLDKMFTNFKGTVVMGARRPQPPSEFPGFPVTTAEMETRPMLNPEILEKYERRSQMRGRYVVLHELDGTRQGAIRGRMIYRETEDFPPPLRTRYQNPPYVLEALMQMTNFYLFMRDENEERSIIPYRLGELTFFGTCTDGQELTIEGRLKDQNDKGVIWDLRASDDKGAVIVYARDMMLKWFGA
ncbi:MAG: SDR family NAD(P)-dependent oxidoreductase [Desulfomonile sp.]|nr:SDR family NAD(P)-dependent oxidoreductase [Desulfomonile sp.]